MYPSLAVGFRRFVFYPLQALGTGSPRWSYWRELERTQYLETSVLADRQLARLKELLAFVYEKNRFYRQRLDAAGVRPGRDKVTEVLTALPVLTKPEIRGTSGGLLSEGFAEESLLTFRTGGSTGQPLTIRITEDCSERRNACAWRHDRWSGWNVGEGRGAVWGNPETPRGILARAKTWMEQPLIYLDTMRLNAHAARRFVRDWHATRSTLLFGHAHSLFEFAQLMRDEGIEPFRPKGIVSSSMSLLPHERRVIESVFDVAVTDRYGCEEVSLIASECERHHGLHLNVENLWIEFLDDVGQPVRSGSPGRIIVTDLWNFAMPFIRYEVEDIGVPSDRACPCGRGLPLMESVSGRIADFLLRRDGSRVAGISLIENTLTRFEGIRQMQIVQDALDRITLNLVPEGSRGAAAGREIAAYIREEFGAMTEVNVRWLQAIEREPSGKYRFSVCKVPAGSRPGASRS